MSKDVFTGVLSGDLIPIQLTFGIYFTTMHLYFQKLSYQPAVPHSVPGTQMPTQRLKSQCEYNLSSKV